MVKRVFVCCDGSIVQYFTVNPVAVNEAVKLTHCTLAGLGKTVRNTVSTDAFVVTCRYLGAIQHLARAISVFFPVWG